MKIRFVAAAAGVAILASLLLADPVQAQRRLSTKDQEYLEGVLHGLLYDPPQGAERVSVITRVRTMSRDFAEAYRGGWLVHGKGGEPDRIYFADGESIPVSPELKLTRVDFVADCHFIYNRVLYDPAADEARGRVSDQALRNWGSEELAHAAWLYRLGNEDLAARALAAARNAVKNGDPEADSEPDPRPYLRSDFLWWAFDGMVHAYMVRADAEALAHGETLLRLRGDETAESHSAVGKGLELIEDLKRRQRNGTLGQAPPPWPADFETWDTKKKTAWLIDSLDEAGMPLEGAPYGSKSYLDVRIGALVQLGEAAVPDLLGALETDGRLTRYIYAWRDFDVDRSIMTVRDAELDALTSILHLGDMFNGAVFVEMPQLPETVRRLRAYWDENKSQSLDERQMKALTDPNVDFKAKREAVKNLVNPAGAPEPNPPNPVIAKFSNPTAAEAILAAMDAELAAYEAGPRSQGEGYYLYERRSIAEIYLSALISLGDSRIAPELARRATSALAAPDDRRGWALAAHFLGDPKPFAAFAEDFRAGRLPYPPGQDGKEGWLEAAVAALSRAGTPEAALALDALAEPGHPAHVAIVRLILGRSTVLAYENNLWFQHPYCLRILRRLLDDTSPTGLTQVLEGASFARRGENGFGGTAPDFLAALHSPHREIPELTRDAAALQLADLVFGAPRALPFFDAPDKRLTLLKSTLDRYRFERASPWLAGYFGADPANPHFMPGIQPLSRAATAADVEQGKAIFHLDGQARPVDMKLPALATLLAGRFTEQPSPAVILQAEAGPGGEVTYGVLTAEEILTVPASKLENIRPLPSP